MSSPPDLDSPSSSFPPTAWLALHESDEFGYQQIFLFDDLWASAHPDLAASLLRYGAGWDP